jgi:hypothetical protein
MLERGIIRRGMLRVEQIRFTEAREFVTRWHYAGGMHNGPTFCAGLFDGRHLVGVCAFATPVSEACRASVFGWEWKGSVTELHRLVLLDEIGHNAESHFVTRSLKLLKQARPDLWAVLSFADEGQGHVGTIYQACNAFWCGSSPGRVMYRDRDGRLRHRRQCGVNVSRDEALARGWSMEQTGKKQRYLLLAPDDRSHRRWLNGHLQIAPKMPYPKIGYEYQRVLSCNR